MPSVISPKISLDIVEQAASQADSLANLLNSIPFFPASERAFHVNTCIAMADSVAVRLAGLVGGAA